MVIYDSKNYFYMQLINDLLLILIQNRNLFLYAFLLPLTNDETVDVLYVNDKLVIACLPPKIWPDFPRFSNFAVLRRLVEIRKKLAIMFSEPCDN